MLVWGRVAKKPRERLAQNRQPGSEPSPGRHLEGVGATGLPPDFRAHRQLRERVPQELGAPRISVRLPQGKVALNKPSAPRRNVEVHTPSGSRREVIFQGPKWVESAAKGGRRTLKLCCLDTIVAAAHDNQRHRV